MVCTTLTVTQPTPSVGVVVETTGFSQEGVMLNSDCSALVGDITGSGKYLGAGATIRVSNAKAKYDLRFDYKLDGVSKSFTATDIIQDLGDTTQYVATTSSYEVGTYTNLTASIQNVRNG